MKEYAIIVAGGSGSRMKNDTPKQFLLLDGRPILLRTIEAFIDYSRDITIILVLPFIEVSRWEKICKDFQVTFSIILAGGGASRFQSVKNGLAKIDVDESLVAVHDGVRPLIHPEIIASSFRMAQSHGSAIASTPLKESLRIRFKDHTKATNRTEYRSIQTPQTFRTDLIKAAYKNNDDSLEFTDDASVVEKDGNRIYLFEGSYENIKITTPDDLLFAEAILKSRKKRQ
jgi:2-C-methyl-D-erythritol 4-phosphate cytidylyltransferase